MEGIYKKEINLLIFTNTGIKNIIIKIKSKDPNKSIILKLSSLFSSRFLLLFLFTLLYINETIKLNIMHPLEKIIIYVMKFVSIIFKYGSKSITFITPYVNETDTTVIAMKF